MKEFNNVEDLTTFIDERQQVVVDDVNRIADEYMINGEQAALTMLNDIISANDLKVWEANVIQSKVCRELTKRKSLLILGD